MLPAFHVSDSALERADSISSWSSATDQYASTLAIEWPDAQEGHCESSMGSMTLLRTLEDDDRFMLALVDAEESLRKGYVSSANGSAWVDAKAVTVVFGDRAWFGDARYFSSTEEAEAAFAEFQSEYSDRVVMAELDSRGLLSPAAWSMRPADVLFQVREANAFSDEEWQEIEEAAWEADQ